MLLNSVRDALLDLETIFFLDYFNNLFNCKVNNVVELKLYTKNNKISITKNTINPDLKNYSIYKNLILINTLYVSYDFKNLRINTYKNHSIEYCKELLTKLENN